MSEKQQLTPTEEAEVQQWLTTAERLKASPGADTDEAASILEKLDAHLSSRTTLLGTKPSRADAALYAALAPAVRAWTAEQRTGEKQGRPHVVRHLDFVQNAPAGFFGDDAAVVAADKIVVDPEEVLYVKPPVDAKAEKERLKKEKAAAAAAAAGGAAATVVDRTKAAAEAVKDAAVDAKDKVVAAATAATTTTTGTTGAEPAEPNAAAAAAAAAKPKKEKKEKAPKAPKAPAAAASPPSPRLIDLRVGHILKAIKHPEADSLYVSTIAMGDALGSSEDVTEYEGQACRTVCSGLNGLVPLESMQGRKVVVVANLKPVKMRGIKSCAMVLAASPRLAEGEADDHKGPVELVSPPEGAEAGERVWFQGWEGEPEGVLNPKKKVWETFQPGFTTTDDLEVAFDGRVVKEAGKEEVGKLVTASGGVCTVQSLKGATVR
ncbi:G4 quadruplex nucleic acid binding protein [Diatrype stigma]|uniref:G4 quadruplex nucleic acid binding protein n=1 Tax=Diatrype stigma TaxID=117547 RepID=A0AAN9YRK6_9PEZI